MFESEKLNDYEGSLYIQYKIYIYIMLLCFENKQDIIEREKTPG